MGWHWFAIMASPSTALQLKPQLQPQNQPLPLAFLLSAQPHSRPCTALPYHPQPVRLVVSPLAHFLGSQTIANPLRTPRGFAARPPFCLPRPSQAVRFAASFAHFKNNLHSVNIKFQKICNLMLFGYKLC